MGPNTEVRGDFNSAAALPKETHRPRRIGVLDPNKSASTDTLGTRPGHFLSLLEHVS